MIFFAVSMRHWWRPIRALRTRFTVEGIEQPRLLGLCGTTRLHCADATSGSRGILRSAHERVIVDFDLFVDPVWAVREIGARVGHHPADWRTVPLTPPHFPARLRFARRWRAAWSIALPTLLTIFTEGAVHYPKLLGFAGATTLRWEKVTTAGIARAARAGPAVTLRAPGRRVTLRLAAFQDPDAVLAAVLVRLPRQLPLSSVDGLGGGGRV